jgi:hypothetical protein
MLLSACSRLMAASAAAFLADLLLLQTSPTTILLLSEAPAGRKILVCFPVSTLVVLYQA